MITLLSVAHLLLIDEPLAYLRVFRGVDPLLLGTTGIALAVAYILRALRVAVVLGLPPTRTLLRISVLHNLLSALLPMKLGEATLPVLLRREGIVSLSSGVGVLLGVRLFDVLALGCVAGGVLAIGGEKLGGTSVRWIGGLLAVVSIATVLGLPGVAAVSERLSAWCSHRWPGVGRMIAEISANALRATGRRGLPLFYLSAGAWCLVMLAFLVAGRAFGLAVSPAESVLATSAAALAFALPINGLAGIGPVQLTWAGVMAALDHDYAAAFSAALAVQVTALATMVGLAAALSSWGLFCERLRPQSDTH